MRLVAALGLAGAVGLCGPPDCRAAEAPALTIRLYNSARVPEPRLTMARDVALGILRDAGIHVRIRDCGPCDEPLSSSDVVVRLIPAPAFSSTLHPEAFGVTYVVRNTDRAWLATAFVDRIEMAAARVGVDGGRLLGRVIAHEVGHLLLGAGYHGAIGVMQAEWTDAVLARHDREWRFSPLEAARITQRITHR